MKVNSYYLEIKVTKEFITTKLLKSLLLYLLIAHTTKRKRKLKRLSGVYYLHHIKVAVSFLELFIIKICGVLSPTFKVTVSLWMCLLINLLDYYLQHFKVTVLFWKCLFSNCVHYYLQHVKVEILVWRCLFINCIVYYQ